MLAATPPSQLGCTGGETTTFYHEVISARRLLQAMYSAQVDAL